MKNAKCCMLYVVCCLMFFSIFFVHSKIFIIFAHNILKPYHEANLSQRPVAGNNKNAPQFLRALRQKEVGATNVFASLR